MLNILVEALETEVDFNSTFVTSWLSNKGSFTYLFYFSMYKNIDNNKVHKTPLIVLDMW